MTKKSKKAKKAVKKPRYKVLYKRFIKQWGSSSNRLLGPYSHKSYFNKAGEELTTKNAIGFKVIPVKGSLRMCSVGYHAAEKKHLWCFGGQRVYKVRLYGAVKNNQRDNKWFGRRFTIISRYR